MNNLFATKFMRNLTNVCEIGTGTRYAMHVRDTGCLIPPIRAAGVFLIIFFNNPKIV
jgi:hypothetical protein